MKFAILSMLLCSAFAHASVQAFLKKDPIVFYVQDEPGNADATNIFYNLDVAAHGTTILEKEFTTSTGNISINCSYSRIDLDSTCTIRIKRDEHLDMNNRYMVIYQLNNTDDATELYLHTVKDTNGRTNFYSSEEQELSMSIEENYFTLAYFIKGDD
jgi:hypothetical protein